MSRLRTSGWAAALSLLLVAGCEQEAGNAPSGSTDPTSAAGPADGPTTEQTTTSVPPDRRQAQDPPPRVSEKQAGLFFPRMSGPEGVALDALGGGRLFVEDGCIYLGPTERRYRGVVSSDVVVWPHGYSLSRKGGEVRVLNEEGRVVARVGETVSMGVARSGGRIPAVPPRRRRGGSSRRDAGSWACRTGVGDRCGSLRG